MLSASPISEHRVTPLGAVITREHRVTAAIGALSRAVRPVRAATSRLALRAQPRPRGRPAPVFIPADASVAPFVISASDSGENKTSPACQWLSADD